MRMVNYDIYFYIWYSHSQDDVPLEEDGREGLKFMGFALTEDNENTPERYGYENNVKFNWKIYINVCF